MFSHRPRKVHARCAPSGAATVPAATVSVAVRSRSLSLGSRFRASIGASSLRSPAEAPACVPAFDPRSFAPLRSLRPCALSHERALALLPLPEPVSLPAGSQIRRARNGPQAPRRGGSDGHASTSPRRSRTALPVPELPGLLAAPPAAAVLLTAAGTGTTSRARPSRPSPPPSVEASSGAGAKLDWRTAACEQSLHWADAAEVQPVSHANIASITRPSAVGSIHEDLVAARPDRPDAVGAGRNCAGGWWAARPSNRRATSADLEGRET